MQIIDLVMFITLIIMVLTAVLLSLMLVAFMTMMKTQKPTNVKTKDLPVISPDAETVAEGALIGEDPVRTDEVRKQQDAADAQALLEKQQAEIQRTIDESMSKYQNAMQATFSEIMTGVPIKRKSEDK